MNVAICKIYELKEGIDRGMTVKTVRPDLTYTLRS